VAVVSSGHLAAVLVHRTFDESGVDLARAIRALDPHVPIIMVSGADRSEAALAAGANAFLQYDEWLRAGTVVADHLRTAHSAGDTAQTERPAPSRESTLK
jgi:hypothetical protein